MTLQKHEAEALARALRAAGERTVSDSNSIRGQLRVGIYRESECHDFPPLSAFDAEVFLGLFARALHAHGRPAKLTAIFATKPPERWLEELAAVLVGIGREG